MSMEAHRTKAMLQFILGLFVGAVVGVFMFALLIINDEDDPSRGHPL